MEPIIVSSYLGSLHIVQLLLEAGAKVNSRGNITLKYYLINYVGKIHIQNMDPVPGVEIATH